jgi:TetR/AcrR family transcriptional regulator
MTEIEAPPEQNTKDRILRAAFAEFARYGASGARVERIAKAAQVNIRMIYYFFGSKRALLDEVLSEIFRERLAQAPARHENLAGLLKFYLEGYATDRDRVRLLEWEALETELPGGAEDLTNLKARRAAIQRRIALIEDLQRRGEAPADLDPMMLYLAFVALTIYPMSFPQSVFVATGDDAGSEKFLSRYKAFLGKLAEALSPTKA